MQKKFTVIFTLFDKTMKATVLADSEEQAISKTHAKILTSVKIESVAKPDSEPERQDYQRADELLGDFFKSFGHDPGKP